MLNNELKKKDKEKEKDKSKLTQKMTFTGDQKNYTLFFMEVILTM